MELSSFMSAQVAQLQHTVQLSILDKTLSIGTAGMVEMLQLIPEAPAAEHPHKGKVIDISV